MLYAENYHSIQSFEQRGEAGKQTVGALKRDASKWNHTRRPLVPAEAGTQSVTAASAEPCWIPAFAGMSGPYFIAR